MELSCPKCETRFSIADDMLGSSGRKVRCSVCSHVWHAAPADQPLTLELEAAAPRGGRPQPAEPTAAPARNTYADSPPQGTADRQTANTGTADNEPSLLPLRDVPTWKPMPSGDPPQAPAASPSPAPSSTRARGGRRQGRWGSVIVGLALLAAVGVTYGLRDTIVAAVPAAKAVFQLAEIPLSQAGEGLEFVNLSSGPVVENGQPMLRVTGFIENTVDFRRQIPWVQVEVRDAQNRIVATASRPPPQPGSIDAQAAMRIVYDLPQPDGTAETVDNLTVTLRFVEGP